MPFAFHADRAAKAEQQYLNAKMHIGPFIENESEINQKHVLEIGCGEGGILHAFLDRDCTCVGVDLSASKIDYAKGVMSKAIKEKRLSFISGDIFDPKISNLLEQQFDIILMKDTIEHIYGHDQILSKIKVFLRDGGIVFVAFPPWRMPYEGHQQMSDSKLGKLPYYHLLPRPIYRSLLKFWGESEARITGLMEVADTCLSINQFEKLLHKTKYRTLRQQFYLINPIYEYKFGLKRLFGKIIPGCARVFLPP